MDSESRKIIAGEMNNSAGFLCKEWIDFAEKEQGGID